MCKTTQRMSGKVEPQHRPVTLRQGHLNLGTSFRISDLSWSYLPSGKKELKIKCCNSRRNQEHLEPRFVFVLNLPDSIFLSNGCVGWNMPHLQQLRGRIRRAGEGVSSIWAISCQGRLLLVT